MTISQHDLLRAFTVGCSADRLSKYRQPGDSDGMVLARYLWNTLLSEALYPTMQALEVTLRNSMHDAIAAKYANTAWYDIAGLLERDDRKQLAVAKQKLSDAAVKQRVAAARMLTPGRIVAELPFGFWTSLLNSPYETNRAFWPQLVVPVFPHAPRARRTRRTLAERAHRIRILRNRISHHEPIWASPRLVQTHSDILAMISWINPAICDTIKLFDRFPTVYAAGQAHCLTELQKIMT
jgi:hypothetical protein